MNTEAADRNPEERPGANPYHVLIGQLVEQLHRQEGVTSAWPTLELEALCFIIGFESVDRARTFISQNGSSDVLAFMGFNMKQQAALYLLKDTIADEASPSESWI